MNNKEKYWLTKQADKDWLLKSDPKRHYRERVKPYGPGGGSRRAEEYYKKYLPELPIPGEQVESTHNGKKWITSTSAPGESVEVGRSWSPDYKGARRPDGAIGIHFNEVSPVSKSVPFKPKPYEGPWFADDGTKITKDEMDWLRDQQLWSKGAPEASRLYLRDMRKQYGHLLGSQAPNMKTFWDKFKPALEHESGKHYLKNKKEWDEDDIKLESLLDAQDPGGAGLTQ